MRFVQSRGEFFCSEAHAEEFFRVVVEQPAAWKMRLEPGNGGIGGSDGRFQIDCRLVISKDRKGGIGDA